jgi:hypothetical protein
MNERIANSALSDRAESHREVIRILACTSDACRQGRMTCPTPAACEIGEQPLSRYDRDGVNLLHIAIYAVVGSILGSLLLAWVIGTVAKAMP